MIRSLTTYVLAFVFFMASFVLSTSATYAQAEPNQNQLALSLEGNGGTILVKTHLLSECIGGYTAFGELQKFDRGSWVSQLPWSEMNLGLLNKVSSTRSAYVFVDTMTFDGVYPKGIYRMHVIRRTVGGGRSCTAQAKVTHTETPYLVLGATKEDLMSVDLPKIEGFVGAG